MKTLTLLPLALILLGTAGCTKDYSSYVAFDWFNIEKSECAAIDKPMNDALNASFICIPISKSESRDDNVALRCSEKSEEKEYLLYATKEACVNARENQRANAP